MHAAGFRNEGGGITNTPARASSCASTASSTPVPPAVGTVQDHRTTTPKPPRPNTRPNCARVIDGKFARAEHGRPAPAAGAVHHFDLLLLPALLQTQAPTRTRVCTEASNGRGICIRHAPGIAAARGSRPMLTIRQSRMSPRGVDLRYATTLSSLASDGVGWVRHLGDRERAGEPLRDKHAKVALEQLWRPDDDIKANQPRLVPNKSSI
ncbi:hypothetical protein C8F04DRAFT_1201476 [Mycena alexandri]|uniref:Uncharacterized protein n=1 Tax=Mycena alexandri TaxID=1745969 RepID=A0AAD6WLF7_9AGAR|nr:hypothetical protein C8F04DRAFT_1201476 [Mycena alexandri]